jgi:prepilin-type N-terminal cleavage/methylation domain-containing protein
MIPRCFIERQYSPMNAKGFTLVELVVTIVLVGIIGTFTSLFLYTGLNGYLRARDTAEGALSAQIALDRISLELRDIKNISDFAANTNIDYTSVTLPGNRQIIFYPDPSPNPDPKKQSIALSVDGNENPLLDNVASFNMNATYADLNYFSSGGNQVQAIEVTFTVGEIRRQFSTRIFPRNMVPEPK